MIKEDLEKLKYPIGKYISPDAVTSGMKESFIGSIVEFPGKLATAVENLSDKELLYCYRPGSWNIRQLVHHCADSHMNAFIRFKLALTEQHPTVKPYDENKWAELMDTRIGDISWSLRLLEGLHHRWGLLLQSMSPDDYLKSFYHPENKSVVSLNECLSQYAWHCDHHLAQILQAIQTKY